MVKKAKAFAGGNGDDPAPEEVHEVLLKYATMDDGVYINCHLLPKGSVIELTEVEADSHRAHGVRLDDVEIGDTRDVFPCREKYEAQDGN